jgi:putative ABC transport system permease protein
LYYPLGNGPIFAPGYPPDPGKLIVRGRGEAAALLIPSLRAIIHDLDPAIPAPDISLVRSSYAAELAAPRFNTVLLAIFAGLALVLAAVGLFGVLSYTVSRRTREIGIRVALGARADDVRSLVVRQGMFPVLTGLVLGVLAAFFTARLLTSLLYGVAPHDTIAFVAAGAVLTATALLACYLPARRATRVDPMTALRSE